MNYAVHGSFNTISKDDKIITEQLEYNVTYYNSIYKLIFTLCSHISKVNDVICKYDLTPTMLYNILHRYYGSNNVFSEKELYLLNLIGHEHEHKGINLKNTNIPYKYFIDLDEYISLHNL